MPSWCAAHIGLSQSQHQGLQDRPLLPGLRPPYCSHRNLYLPSLSPNKKLCHFLLGSKGPTFNFADDSHLTCQSLTEHLRTLLISAGHDATVFASHSFRIGTATTAAAAGLPDWLIQARSRWSSSCFTTYIHTPPHIIASAARSTPVLPYWHAPVIAITGCKFPLHYTERGWVESQAQLWRKN